jgi:hypothetical protein
MTAWIVLLALTVGFTLAARRVHPNEPPLPPGYDGQRQLAELRALVATDTNAPALTAQCPDIPRPARDRDIGADWSLPR